MAIHHPTPSLGGGERPRLPSACRSGGERYQVGPVTQAIRAIRSAEPGFGLCADLRSARLLSRTEVETVVENLIDLLDAWDGDTDQEPEALDASAAEWTGRGAHRFNVGEAA